MFASYKRYSEPNLIQVLPMTLISGAISTLASHPFEFLKTKIQIYNEGIGIRQHRMAMGYNPYLIFRRFHQQGYGTSVLYTGFQQAMQSRMSYLLSRNLAYYFMYSLLKPEKPTNDLNYREKGVIGAIAGALGALVSNQYECAFVRTVGDLGRS